MQCSPTEMPDPRDMDMGMRNMFATQCSAGTSQLRSCQGKIARHKYLGARSSSQARRRSQEQ